MNAKPRHVSGWMIPGVILAILVACATGLWFGGQWLLARKWILMERKIEAMVEVAKSNTGQRAVLWGETAPGNALDDYAHALEEMKAFDGGGPFLKKSYQTNLSDRTQAALALESYEKPLEHLHKGAHRDCSPYDDPLNIRHSKWPACLVLQSAAAWFNLDRGMTRKTCETLLDGAQFARDSYSWNEFIEGSSDSMGEVLADIRDLLLSGKASADDLRFLELGLGRLDESFPSFRALLLNEAIHFANTIQQNGGLLDSFDDQGRSGCGLRYGYSTRLMSTESVDIVEHALVQCTSDCDAGSWNKVRPALEQADLEIKTCRNPLVGILAMQLDVTRAVQSGRERRAQLRLLRMAAHYLASGDVRALGDPLGTDLQHRIGENRLKLWSVGAEGVDHGGIGDWDPAKGKNIVLEVRR
jgi:hypothetical protein